MSSTVSPGNEESDFESKWRQHKACARCHRLKMKCAYSDPTFKSCKRCFAIGADCSPDVDPTAKYAKKRRVLAAVSKPKVTRSASSATTSSVDNVLAIVESLNKELDSLKKAHTILDPAQLEKLRRSITSANLALHKIGETLGGSAGDENYLYPHIPFSHNIAKELIFNYQSISLSECKQRFDFFMNQMMPYYPVISFSKSSQDFRYLLDHYPLLLLTCISVTFIHDNGFLSSHIENKNLEKLVRHYLEKFLSYRLYIQADGFNIQLIQICIILSVWLPPPNKLGHFKNLVNLLLGLNVALCIGLGDESMTYTNKEEQSDVERNDLRTFLSVYCNCGSLGLSLYRFKLVNWSVNHDLAISKLQKDPKLITSGDKYLIYYAKSIKLSQEIYQTMGIGGKHQQSVAVVPPTVTAPASATGVDLPYDKLSFIAENYELQLFNLLRDSGFLDSSSKQANLLAIMYYQVLLAMYDKLLNVHLNETKGGKDDDLTYLNVISKLITICENMLNSYIQLNVKETVNYPTFVYYRPMHALVLLIRLRLLSKAEASVRTNPEALAIKINVEYYFGKISSIISDNQKKYNLDISLAMKEILTKIEKWLKVSEEYTSSPGDVVRPMKENRSSLLIHLMDKSKHQEIEALEVPHDVLESALPKNEPTDQEALPIVEVAAVTATTATTTPPYSIQELFQEMDVDVMNYLNLLESNSNTHTVDPLNVSTQVPDSFAENDSYFANFFSANQSNRTNSGFDFFEN